MNLETLAAFFAALNIISTLLIVYLSVYIIQKHGFSNMFTFIILLWVAAFHTLVKGLMVVSSSTEIAGVVENFRWLFLAFIPPFVLIFIFDVTGRGHRLTPIGRFGGEEFVILLPETPLFRPINNTLKTKDLDPLPAQIVAERLRQTITQEALEINGYNILLTVSLGVAEYTISDQNIENVIDHADQALLQAKKQGRNRVIAGSTEGNLAKNSN